MRLAGWPGRRQGVQQQRAAAAAWRRLCTQAGPRPLSTLHNKPLHARLLAPRRLIREFEREARTDGMPPNELNARKKEMVQQLNGFIGMKKAFGAQAAQRGELLEGAQTAQQTVDSESWLRSAAVQRAPGPPPPHARSTGAAALLEAGLRGAGRLGAVGKQPCPVLWRVRVQA